MEQCLNGPANCDTTGSICNLSHDWHYLHHCYECESLPFNAHSLRRLALVLTSFSGNQEPVRRIQRPGSRATRPMLAISKLPSVQSHIEHPGLCSSTHVL